MIAHFFQRRRFRPSAHVLARFALCGAAVLASGCGKPPSEGDGGEGPTVVSAWVHSGRESERTTIREHVRRFNRRQDTVRVDLTVLPEGSYNSQVQAAALANDLPDVLEFDGPFIYNYVWQGHLIPIGDRLRRSVVDNLLPSIVEQGTYRGELYSVGMFDSGLALYGRRSMLEAAGVRIPKHPKEAWTAEEFEQALSRLARRDEDGQVLDLKLNYEGEWYTYAFSPALQSAGAGLIDRTNYGTASGVLNSPAAVDVLSRFQRWINEEGYVDPNVDDNSFVGERVALSWVGHWEYPRYSEAFGEDLVLMPLPDFGEGSKTGQGSWNWGVTRRCAAPDAAVQFLEFLLGERQVLEMSRANGAVPATNSTIEASELYSKNSPLRLFVVQLRAGYAVPRPATPAYPVITSSFQDAFQAVRNGEPPSEALNRAVKQIDQDIEDNQGYPAQ